MERYGMQAGKLLSGLKEDSGQRDIWWCGKKEFILYCPLLIRICTNTIFIVY
jgi:hypothetical protein